MVDAPWRLILKRLESESPKLAKCELGDAWQRYLELGWLRPAEPVRALPCPECDGARLLPLAFIQHQTTKLSHAYLACPECGSVEIDVRQLERWRIDPLAVVKTMTRNLFPASNLPAEILPGRLWRVGKVALAGKPREIFFTCGFRPSLGTAVLGALHGRTKSVLWMPSEIGVSRWSKATSHLVLALDSLAVSAQQEVELDQQLLESRVAAHFCEMPKKTKPKRRSVRMANIEALQRELREHLRAARDHAVTSRDLSGEAQLLPRPTKEELGKRARVSPSAVTRCFSDEAGANLRLMWEWAADLDRILTFREN
jgi:hypothetical protein